MVSRKIKVLIVDDSALVREMLASGLSRDPLIEVVGKAGDAYAARDKIVRLSPDVITLDVEMPRMNGVDFLKQMMPQYPLPVIMVSSLTNRGSKITLEALDAGAVDFVLKPSSVGNSGFGSMIKELCEKIKVAATVDVSGFKQADYIPRKSQRSTNRELVRSNKLIAIGASTGGTRVVTDIVSDMPADFPGVVIVQHMPPVFTRMFAEHLNEISELSVKEAVDGDFVKRGEVLVAPGGKQLRVLSDAKGYVVQVEEEAKVNGFAPSVDVLFRSVAVSARRHAIGVILTGMGRDGAEGLKQMRLAGARTLGQDEDSSVVFGMPKEANEIGAVEKLLPPANMVSEMMRLLEEMK